ncbi:hypothetical protein Pmani_000001 [Petrolisthes manimaculis]|uniref:Uncharacterized protein n=1 Tax=Petrolisthes manimaculis TaxID=1843537 RepID=A0AAE1QN80_9EUCA|nr:hypothetical protein Pmani_000001 [Petrolisthes manimaculis]
MLAFCTFLGFVGLWFKNDEPEIDSSEMGLRKDGHKDGPNHIVGGLDKSRTNHPVAQVAEPDGQDHNNQIIHVNDEADRLPLPHLPPNPQPFQPPQQNQQQRAGPPRLPSNEDVREKMKAERWFQEDDMKVVPGLGEGGKAVRLTGEDGRRAQEIIKKEAFNLIASDKISLNRSVPDSRDSL